MSNDVRKLWPHSSAVGNPTAATLREYGMPVPGKPGVYELGGCEWYSAELLKAALDRVGATAAIEDAVRYG